MSSETESSASAARWDEESDSSEGVKIVQG